MTAACARCGADLPPSRGPRPRKWRSEDCRRAGELPQVGEGMVTHEEVLELLSWRARRGSVPAMSALLRYFERTRLGAEEGGPDRRFAELDASS
jgi:hypothetical protein